MHIRKNFKRQTKERSHVTEDEFREKGEIETTFGETLSWMYLCYVREHPAQWTIPTHILYGEKDNLTSYETVSEFVNQSNATLTVMKNGEHQFHTEDQMKIPTIFHPFLFGFTFSMILYSPNS